MDHVQIKNGKWVFQTRLVSKIGQYLRRYKRKLLIKSSKSNQLANFKWLHESNLSSSFDLLS